MQIIPPRQRFSMEPRTGNQLSPRGTLLFLLPARRVNWNTSPVCCVTTAVTAARTHGHMTAMWRITHYSFLTGNTHISGGHCEWLTGRTPYPNYRQLLITHGVIKNQAAEATITHLWKMSRNAAAPGGETVNYALFHSMYTHQWDVGQIMVPPHTSCAQRRSHNALIGPPSTSCFPWWWWILPCR